MPPSTPLSVSNLSVEGASHRPLSIGISSTTASLVHMSGPSILFEGWVLKKRRKKMQGFARRYFTLYHSGILSYAFEPGQPIRDQILLHNAAISTAPGRKDIHIDSNTATFHIKCLSKADFDSWMSAFRKFISIGQEAKKSATFRHNARQASISYNINRSGILMDEMGDTIFGLESIVANLYIDFAPVTSVPAVAKKQDKSQYGKESKFGLFKRPAQHSQPSPGAEHIDISKLSLHDTLEDLKSRVEKLKSQHSTLLKTMQQSLSDPKPSSLALSSTVEEEEYVASPRTHGHRHSPSFTHNSYRDSIATTNSDSCLEWFDAVDEGPQEFLMDPGNDISEPGSRVLGHDIDPSLETSSIDTDIEEQPLDASISGDTGFVNPSYETRTYRTHLPCPPPADEGSLFTILKKNVGKDLSTITFPVTFNEPLTLLQRAAEEIEYFNLLDEAAGTDDPVNRMAYIAAFTVSSYAHTRYRSGRKGFNPMLGETFEDVRMRFIAEKVRHNPLEIAYHAEGKHWDLTAVSAGKTKFWGKSLEIIPVGTTTLRIGTDIYSWNKPSSFVRNLVVGTKYLDHCGQMTIENKSTGLHCVLDFKQNGYWGPSNIVAGTIFSADDEVIGHLEGKWDDQMSQTLDASRYQILWKINSFPKHTQEYYGFTGFSFALNEITQDMVGKLPPTDSRYRPDVRALENGELDLAEEEKLRVEQLQRDRRNSGKDRPPRWFKQVGNQWEYAGGYWEGRARHWKGETMVALW